MNPTPRYHNPNNRDPALNGQHQVQQPVPVPDQDPRQEPVQEQQPRQNIIALPPRQAPPFSLPPAAKWMLWVAAVLAATALLAFILSQVDELDQAPESRPQRRNGHRYYDDDTDDLLEEWFPTFRERDRQRQQSQRQQTPAPTFNLHLPGGTVIPGMTSPQPTPGVGGQQ